MTLRPYPVPDPEHDCTDCKYAKTNKCVTVCTNPDSLLAGWAVDSFDSCLRFEPREEAKDGKA